jgi:hypothetical protein
MLLDRLDGEGKGLVEVAWQRILSETYTREELFTLQLHPERTALCSAALSSVLQEARRLTPSVWLARLDQIAAWWRARVDTRVEISAAAEGGWQVTLDGPPGTTVLVRNVEIDAPSLAWADGYRQVQATTFTLRAPLRPIIGVAPGVSPKQIDSLRQYGYIVEINPESHPYAYYYDLTEFSTQQPRRLLTIIEEAGRPLLRLGRWPNGARSALAITGDIDALTLWDYGLRLFGR